MLRKVLFETKAGDALLSLFERITGLGIYILPDHERQDLDPKWLLIGLVLLGALLIVAAAGAAPFGGLWMR